MSVVSSIREVLTAKDLAHIAEHMEAIAMPSLLFASGTHSEEACTRIGGRPNLPEAITWPTWRDSALPFIAQLDLMAMPHIGGLDLPSRGSLYFFYEGGQEAWGFRPEDRGSAQVIYSLDSLQEHPLRALPKEIPDEMRFRGVRLDPEVVDLSVPDLEDQVLEPLHLSVEERDRHLKFLQDWGAGKPFTSHRVGGYPEPLQGDPKLEAQLVFHDLYCGDPSGFRRGKELGLWPGATDWQLLLQVDSDEKVEMMWGDVGRLYFLLRKQDLALCQFERTWLIFQCL